LLVGALIAVLYSPAPAAQAVELSTWQTLPSVPVARMEAQGVAYQGKLYILGGFTNAELRATRRVDVYNPATRSWSRLADLPEALTHAAVAADNGSLWVIGGYVGDNPGPSTKNVWRYDIGRNSWSAGPSLPKAIGGGGAAVVGRKLYHFGGAVRSSTTTTATDVAEGYVLNLDDPRAWSTVASLPGPRNHVGVAAVGGKVYVAGGQLGKYEATTSQRRVDVYNPATNGWSRAADLPFGRSHISASTISYKGQIYAIGGSADDGKAGRSLADVVVYDPATNRWTALRSLPAARKTPIAGIIDGRLYVATGNQSNATSTHWAATLSGFPTATPTRTATRAPASAQPNEMPSDAPTETPAVAPTSTPTDVPPTETPTEAPTDVPPTETPTEAPTDLPPAETPTEAPTDDLGEQPSATPEPTATPLPAPPADPVRINAGGPAQTVDGVTWRGCESAAACDGMVSGGFPYGEPDAIDGVAPPANEALYQSEWTGGQFGPGAVPAGTVAFSFRVPVTPGAYLVRLHFAELNKFAPGARVFDVNIEGGDPELADFDLYAEAGGANRVLVREFQVVDDDGVLLIEFIRKVENAKISAIEILPAGQ